MRLKLLMMVVLGLMLMPAAVFGQGDDDLPRPVAPPEDVNLPVDSLAYEANFANTDFWQAGSSPDGQISYEPAADGFAIASPPPDGGIGSIPLLNINIDDFYSEITFRVDTCSSGDSALLMFTRVLPSISDSQFNDAFVYVIQCSGDFRARALSNGGIGDILVSGQTLPLTEGEEYAFGVLMAGNQVAWYLNNELVAQFDIPEGESRSSGSLAPGAQVGFGYTLTGWRIWALKSTGENVEDVPTVSQPAEDPLGNNELGEMIYNPPFGPPTTIPLGLHHDVATYIVDGGTGLNMYNTVQPFGVFLYEGVSGDNYFIEVVFEVRDCGDESSIGLIWRADDDLMNYYVFEIQCDGLFRAYAVIDGERDADFASGRLGGALTEINTDIRLGVYARDDTFFIYGGGTQFASVTDDRLTEGNAGLILASDENGRVMDILASDLVAFDVP